MAMESFVANKQGYWFWPDKNQKKVQLKLGTYFGEGGNREQFKNIAQIKASDKYPFDPELPLNVIICGQDVDFTGKTDLEIYMELQDRFDTNMLW